MSDIIRAEIWVELMDPAMPIGAEIESENIIASSYSEVKERLDEMIAKYEEKFEVVDSGYEIIDVEVQND